MRTKTGMNKTKTMKAWCWGLRNVEQGKEDNEIVFILVQALV